MDRDPRAYILHRPPALCIDAVVSIDAVSAQAARTVPLEATIDGVLWEPWLIEGLAQTAAVLNGSAERITGQRTTKGMLVGVRNLEIHRLPAAGETIRFAVELIKRISPLSLMACRAYVDDQLVADGVLKFYVEAAG
jgi:predicted hotdog family 3-hydroxylacyl-ACP dehydratase